MATTRVELFHRREERILEVHVTGKLEHADYEKLQPVFEELVEEHGPLRLLVRLESFSGWTAGALWDDVKLTFRHGDDIERLAIVGDERWEKGMAAFCKPFTKAEVRFFESHRLSEARGWLQSRSA